MPVVTEDDPNGVEHDGDVLGRSFAGLILWRIGRRSWTGSVGFHVSRNNQLQMEMRGIFSARAGWVYCQWDPNTGLCRVDGAGSAGLRPVAP
jgi:hypothetical protein